MINTQTGRPLVIAHRGASADAPENTLAAFKLAVEQGCDGIELDVHLSKDGQLVVIHDESIERTTNGKGFVSEMTVSQLKKYDAGRWFSRKYKHEKIPLLEEVLAIIPENILLNIEIKNIPFYYKGIEQALLNLLVKKGRMDQVIVSSFDHQCLLRLKKLNSQINIGLLYSENVVDHLSFANMFGMPVTALHPKYVAIQARDIQKAVENGLLVFPWTVNSTTSIKRMTSEGVSGIITNYPSKVRSLMKDYKI